MQDQRHRRRRWVPTGVLVLILAFLGLASGGPAFGESASAAPAGPSAGIFDGDTIGGVSVDDVVSALGTNHVAVIGTTASESELAQIAQQARDGGVNLSIVSLKTRLTSKDAQTLAGEIKARVGGTVLVLTPDSAAQYSDELSGSQQSAAEAAVKAAGGDDVSAARAYMESATAKPFPWSLVVIGLVALVVIGAIVYGVIGRNRRKKADHEALADLTLGLGKRLQVLAPLMLTITSRIGLVDRPDLADRFNRASGDYTRLGGVVATPLTSRAEVDRTAAEIATVEKTLDDIDRQLDTLLPGLEGPSPAG
ncbi:Rv1476 family membrane protein [Nakamurella lactea]|uniref:Rv1476 family membrane protein n=1 Tax=Nakamurella lactea TaxID=459515 RepID=UPI0004253DED|nr:DUF6676 family protein [Nakamurella lactea]